MEKKITILLFLIAFMAVADLQAQSLTSADSSWHEEQIRAAMALERKAFSGPNAPVYQGYEYVPYFLPVSGTPFYLSDEWQPGSVQYAGTWYHDLALLYDAFKDQLVLQSPDKMYRIASDKTKAASFIIAGHEFVRLPKAGGAGNLPEGYYELLFKGRRDSLLARRMKIVNVPTEPGMSRNYRETDTYYIRKDGRYYAVKSKKSVLKVLHDRKQALKKFIREENINYREGREDPILTILRYYDQISE